MRLSVIIPAYNEAATLETIVSRVIGVPYDKQVLIVDDCSNDGTPGVIAMLEKRHGAIIRSFRHAVNQGKGASIRTALPAVDGDVVVVQDADLEYHPEDYATALRLIEADEADAVYGSRFLGSHRAFFFWHYVGNRFLTFLVNVATGGTLTDMETGFKIIRADVFRALAIQSSRFDFEVEVTMKLFRRKQRVYEIPITYTGRGYGEGKKIGWKDGGHALFAILKWCFYA